MLQRVDDADAPSTAADGMNFRVPPCAIRSRCSFRTEARDRATLDLEHEDAMRVTLATVSSSGDGHGGDQSGVSLRCYLLILTHHISFDGISVDIFLRELQTIYSARRLCAYRDGRQSPATAPSASSSSATTSRLPLWRCQHSCLLARWLLEFAFFF